MARSTGDAIQYRVLGNTGEKGVRHWTRWLHLSLPAVDEQLAIRIIRHAIDSGINFLDNSWDYNDSAMVTAE